MIYFISFLTKIVYFRAVLDYVVDCYATAAAVIGRNLNVLLLLCLNFY